ncbi:MAG: hypothetical protein E6G13_10505 [Actinobacteria bacterium]|nr:MAG: hypothetical protein E6G13_10505 [Actinomycetota bacterium]
MAFGLDALAAVAAAAEHHRGACAPTLPRDELDRHLDALRSEQQRDGGWPTRWDSGSATSHLEWRGYMTLEALGLLREHGRLVDLAAS